MFGKQVYKGCLDRTVLSNIDGESPAATPLDRHYTTDELSDLISLGPDGICKRLKRFNPSDKEQSLWRKKCNIDKEYEAITGLSQRTDIYNSGSTRKRKSGEHLDVTESLDDTKLSTLEDDALVARDSGEVGETIGEIIASSSNNSENKTALVLALGSSDGVGANHCLT